jgi:hypothetical protein
MITLTTDFGSSEYVGAMKGVILSICPTTLIVDITHQIRKFDIRRAAYVIYSVCRYFPDGTIHVVVVDPGVGTERRGVIIRAGSHIYIGPDNGVFSLLEDIEEVYEIIYPAKSKTFHGRDVFAPIAARIECGAKPVEFGKKIEGINKIRFKKIIEEDKIKGEVVCVDEFGNVITNIKGEDLDKLQISYGDRVVISVKGKKNKMRFVETYGYAEEGELISLIGSEGYLEIAVNMGNAGRILNLEGGEEVEVSR